MELLAGIIPDARPLVKTISGAFLSGVSNVVWLVFPR
jgi:hypothetical protein